MVDRARIDLLSVALGRYSDKPRWSMERIKKEFSRDDVLAWCASTNAISTGYKILSCLYGSYDNKYSEQEYWPHHAKWCIDYLSWILDEIGMSLDGRMYFGPHVETAVDHVLLQLHPVTRVPCFLFLVNRGISPGMGWDYWMEAECMWWKDGQSHDAIIKRLLDKGCPVPLKYHGPEYPFIDWTMHRWMVRQHCYLVLGLGRRKTSLSGCVPYDVWKLIARQMWAQRWNQ